MKLSDKAQEQLCDTLLILLSNNDISKAHFDYIMKALMKIVRQGETHIAFDACVRLTLANAGAVIESLEGAK